jgi:hypothetical protein
MAYVDSRGGAVQANANGVQPIVSLSGVSATSATPTVLDGLALRTTAIMVVSSSAGTSAGSVQMQGSLDGTHWYNLGSAVSTDSAATVFDPVVVTDTPTRYVSASIASTITGGTVVASVGSSG